MAENKKNSLFSYVERINHEKRFEMPAISMFYGLIVYLYYYDNKKHTVPHIHVEYQGKEAVVKITDGEILEGELHPKKMKLLAAWIEIHHDELIANWTLAVKGEQVFKIDPLR